jgi:hypothetical protein
VKAGDIRQEWPCRNPGFFLSLLMIGSEFDHDPGYWGLDDSALDVERFF